MLPEPASGVHLEFTYSPTERTFSIQSRFEQSAAWSLHVVGSLRAERTESAFAIQRAEERRAGFAGGRSARDFIGT